MPYKFEDKPVEVKQISSGMHHSVLLSKDGNYSMLEYRYLLQLRRCIHHWLWWLWTSWSWRKGNTSRKHRSQKGHYRQENCFHWKWEVGTERWSSFDNFSQLLYLCGCWRRKRVRLGNGKQSAAYQRIGRRRVGARSSYWQTDRRTKGKKRLFLGEYRGYFKV